MRLATALTDCRVVLSSGPLEKPLPCLSRCRDVFAIPMDQHHGDRTLRQEVDFGRASKRRPHSGFRKELPQLILENRLVPACDQTGGVPR